MGEDKELTEDWCKSISPELAVFNKAFVRRAGMGLFPYVLLDGNKEAVKYCVKKEAALFYQAGVYESDKVNTDIRNGKRGVFLADYFNQNEKDVYRKLSDNGSLIFFNSGNPDHANRYDVSGCDIISFSEVFLPLIGMSCENSVIEEVLRKYPSVWTMDIPLLVNNTTLCHYSHADNEILKIEDFNWLADGSLTGEADSNGTQPEVESKEENTDLKKTAPKDTDAHADDKDGSEKTGSFEETGTDKAEQGSTDVRSENENGDDPSAIKDGATDDAATKDKSWKAILPDNGAETVKKAEDDKADVDKSDTKDSEQKDNLEKKDSGLTEQEKTENKNLLDALVKEYKDVIDMIAHEQVPGMFSPVKRILDESIEKTDFEESPAKKYVEISKDFSSDLYKRIYKTTEPMRLEFLDKVKRRYIELTCFNCHHTWQVDATFVDGETGSAECPKCGTMVGYEP